MGPRERAWLALVLAGEAVVCGYLTLVVWVMTHWMVHDSIAFRMTAGEWRWTAFNRFLGGAFVGLLGGGGIFIITRPIFRWLGIEGRRIPLVVAGSFAVPVIIAALIGAIRLAIKKSFL